MGCDMAPTATLRNSKAPPVQGGAGTAEASSPWQMELWAKHGCGNSPGVECRKRLSLRLSVRIYVFKVAIFAW